MKKNVFGLLLACLPCFLAAQSVALDSTFGVNGKTITGLFGLSGNTYGTDFATLPDGKIIIGGRLNELVGLEKYDNSGVLDEKYATAFIESDALETSVCIQQDGKVLLLGENPNDFSTFVIRIDTMGKFDETFGNGGVAQTFESHFLAHNIYSQSDGKAVVFGDEWTNFSSFSAIRLLGDGTLDPSFAVNGKLSIDLPGYNHEVPIAMLEQPDHRLLFAGSIGYPSWNVFLVRVHPDGSLDSSFGNNGILIDSIQGYSNAYALALQPDGKIVVVGDSGPNYQATVVRYNSDGTRDLNFANQGFRYLPEANEGVGVAIRPDGKIIALCWDNDNSLGNLVLAQLLPNGQKDGSFGNNGIFRVIDAGMRPRALSLIGNKATVSARKPTGTTQKRLFRFLLDLNVGTLNPSDPDPTLWVYPNPIVEQFTLEFGLAQAGQVSAYLTDIQGKRVQSFAHNQVFEPGEHALALSCPSHLPAGNYILSLEISGKKMTSVQVTKK